VIVIPLPQKSTEKDEMEVDPSYYAVHIVFFVWGAVLVVFFVQSLVEEVRVNGWTKPRCLWASCLCLSSACFVIQFLDPRTILGLYTPSALKFVESAAVITLASSFGLSGYMYLMALYQRNMHGVPKFVRNAWIILMGTFSVLHAIFSIIGASTGNLYWFGIHQFILALHEILMTTFLNVSICKLANYLKELNQEKNSLGSKGTNFSNALRKMMYVRVISILLTISAVCYQTLLPGAGKDKIAKPFTPILYDNRVFNGMTLIAPILFCTLHSLLLYMLRRPQQKSEKSSKSSERTTEVSIVTSSPPSASSRLSEPPPVSSSSERLSVLAISTRSSTTSPVKIEAAISDIPIPDIPVVIDA